MHKCILYSYFCNSCKFYCLSNYISDILNMGGGMKGNMIQDDSINEVNVDIRYPEMKNICYILGLVGAKKNADYINEQLEKRRERIEKNNNNL